MIYQFKEQTDFYRGKVRDVYFLGSQWIMMLASDRISAFDVILPKTIPYKGQVLNQIAAYMLEQCRDICPIWLKEVPAPNVSLGYRCNPIKIEMVVRGYLTGHAWRTYASGARTLCGVQLPDGLSEFEKLPYPIITPSTKATSGHDEDITPDDIIASGICSKVQWETLSNYALELFERGTQLAAEKDLILADTKYEFGKMGEEIYLMDEIHTPDSSRYFYATDYNNQFQTGHKPLQLSKEFVREWLIENKFMGNPGEKIPEMSDEWVNTISNRYITLFEKLTGTAFHPSNITAAETYILMQEAIHRVMNNLSHQ